MSIEFVAAQRHSKRLRAAIIGIAGSGKTYTSLMLARGLVGPEGRIAVIDTEHQSASLYCGLPGIGSFVVGELHDYSPATYREAILKAGGIADAIVIDSLSHAWDGEGGALEMVDDVSGRGNKFTSGWRTVTPLQNRLIEAMLGSPAHVIATMRVKSDYVLESDERGKVMPKKVGTKVVQRAGIEFEFDLLAEMDSTQTLHVEKCRLIDSDGRNPYQGKRIALPGPEFATVIRGLLERGAPTPVPLMPEQAPAAPPVTKASPSSRAVKVYESACLLAGGKDPVHQWFRDRGYPSLGAVPEEELDVLLMDMRGSAVAKEPVVAGSVEF